MRRSRLGLAGREAQRGSFVELGDKDRSIPRYPGPDLPMIARRYVTGRCLVKRTSNTRGNRAVAQLLEQLDDADCTDPATYGRRSGVVR